MNYLFKTHHKMNANDLEATGTEGHKKRKPLDWKRFHKYRKQFGFQQITLIIITEAHMLVVQHWKYQRKWKYWEIQILWISSPFKRGCKFVQLFSVYGFDDSNQFKMFENEVISLSR